MERDSLAVLKFDMCSIRVRCKTETSKLFAGIIGPEKISTNYQQTFVKLNDDSSSKGLHLIIVVFFAFKKAGVARHAT